MFKILKALMKIIIRRYTVYGIENVAEKVGAIFVCNHAGSYGPLAMGLFFPFEFRPWVLYRTMTAKLCRQQLEKDLFGNCNGIFSPLCKFISFVIEPACIWVMRKVKAIPVYREKSEIFTTFSLSVDALAEGHNLVIFPEKNEAEYFRHLKDCYTGFVHLARKYYHENGNALLFYPVYIDMEARSITICKPEAYNPDVVFTTEREKLANRIMEAIRQCADRNEYDFAGLKK